MINHLLEIISQASSDLNILEQIEAKLTIVADDLEDIAKHIENKAHDKKVY